MGIADENHGLISLCSTRARRFTRTNGILTPLTNAVLRQFGFDYRVEGIDARHLGSKQLEDALVEKARQKYNEKETVIGSAPMRYHERMIMLQIVDSHWKDHLLSMDHLKEGIGLRGYGQRDPLVEYKKESFGLFEDLMNRIEEDTLRFLFLMQPVEEQSKPNSSSESEGGRRP